LAGKPLASRRPSIGGIALAGTFEDLLGECGGFVIGHGAGAVGGHRNLLAY
jgi:hypothetical protein